LNERKSEQRLRKEKEGRERRKEIRTDIKVPGNTFRRLRVLFYFFSICVEIHKDIV